MINRIRKEFAIRQRAKNIKRIRKIRDAIWHKGTTVVIPNETA